MKLSKRTGTALFFLSLFVAFAMQYPLFKVHAGNWDHYFILFLSDTITETGKTHWIANWASYFGLHKISYPQGVPFLFSFFQQLTGDTSESLVLVYSYFESFMAVLFSFSLGLLIRKKDYLFAFFLSFLFSTSPSYLYVTEWTLSARGLFISLLPLFVFLNIYFLSKKNRSKKILFLNILFIFLLFSVHRMAFFLLATVLPSIFLIYLTYNNYFISISRHWSFMSRRYRSIVLIITIVVFLYVVLSFYTQQVMLARINQSLGRGNIFSGQSVYVKILNLSLTFFASGGILVPFGLLSIIDIYKNKTFNYKNIYFILILIFLAFIIFYPSYFRPYASLFLSFFVGIYIIKLYYINKYKIKETHKFLKRITPFLLVLSLIFSLALQARWDGNPGNSSKQWMDYNQEEVISAIKESPMEKFFISSGEISRFSSVYSGKFSFPSGSYAYDYYFYIFTNHPSIISSQNLNLSFYPSVFWDGKIYLYNENIKLNSNIDRLYNLSFYDVFEVRYGENLTSHFSVKNITEDVYCIYSNERYGLFMVDPTSKNVEITRLYFYRP